MSVEKVEAYPFFGRERRNISMRGEQINILRNFDRVSREIDLGQKSQVLVKQTETYINWVEQSRTWFCWAEKVETTRNWPRSSNHTDFWPKKW